MRILLAVAWILGGCDVTGTLGENAVPPSDNREEDPCGGAGGLPPPPCGEGPCPCCVGCSVSKELCFAGGWEFEMGFGTCRSSPVDGSFDALIDGEPFVASDVAAIGTEGYVQINGRVVSAVDARQVSIQLPAQLGTFDCTGQSLAAFAYTVTSSASSALVTDAWNQLRLSPRPACSYTLTAIGEVGERIEGTFAVTLVDRASSSQLELTAGTFSVERVPFP